MPKNKGTSQSNQKPLRFSEIHRRLGEGIQDLIKLYYIFKENKEPFVPMMNKFLNRITGRDIYFSEELRSKEFGNKAREVRRVMASGHKRAEIDDILKGKYFIALKGEDCNLIYYDDFKRTSFLTIMDALQNSILNGVTSHFLMLKWSWRNETSLNDPVIPISREVLSEGIFKRPLEINRSIPERLIHKQAITALRKQQRQETEYFIKGLEWKELKGKQMGVKVLSIPYRTYEVNPITQFGLILLHSLPSDGGGSDNKESNHEVPSVNFDGWCDFIQIVRSLLVDYHVVFGDYRRIKACLQCQKLFFEKRAGEKHFCSDGCRSKFTTEPIGKLRCRKNQNVWISYRIDLLEEEHSLIPSSVKKRQCEKCDLWHPEGGRLKGGKCQILRRKNKEAFEMINKEMEEKIKEKEIKEKKIKKKLQWL